MFRPLPAFLLVALLATPGLVFAFPFGGRASVVLQCVYNSTIYANLGPPRGGEYIWTTATKTYQFGPPTSAGQWLLGLAGAPYYCIYRISPLTIYTGIAITMMGSSGPSAPAAPPTRGPSPPAPAPGSPTAPPIASSSTPPATPGKVLISEVYYSVDAQHGAKPANEWIELYNGTQAAVSIGGWRLEDAAASDVIVGNYTIPPGRFLILAATSTTRTRWGLADDVLFVSLGSSLGDGLSNSGDRVIVRNASGAIVDALSWGTNTSVMQPSVPVVSYGYSTTRTSLSKDTDTANDWAARLPSPGK